MDLLEEMGIVGPQNGSKPRVALITEWPVGGAQEVADFEEDVYEEDEVEDSEDDEVIGEESANAGDDYEDIEEDEDADEEELENDDDEEDEEEDGYDEE